MNPTELNPEQQQQADALSQLSGILDEPAAADLIAAAVDPAAGTPPAESPAPVDPNASPLDELTDDEPIFTGGPTKTEVQAIKLKYPHSSIMALLLADGSGILYRTMTRNDWKVVQKLTRAIEDPEKREEVIFGKICLHPNCEDQTVVGNLPAGVITSVMNEFYLYSGFSPVAESLKL